MIADGLAVVAGVTNGLLAGLFFAFVCAVSPAYRRLGDAEFVSGFRAINHAILRPSFLMVFVGAPLSAILAAAVGTVRGDGGTVALLLWVGAVASAMSFLITVLANVPLNRRLDHAAIGTAAQQRVAREAFEVPWYRWHLLRSAVGTIAFLAVTSVLALG